MPRVFITNENEDHNHVVLIRDDGTGITSDDNGHVHDVNLNISSDLLDVFPVEMIVKQAAPEAFEVEESNGHSHILKEIELEEEDVYKFDSDEDLLAEVGSLINGGIESDDDYINRGKKYYDFYHGKQWDDSDKNKLESTGRACLTINITRSLIRSLSGIQRQNRQDIKYLPIEKSSPFGAEVANVVCKYILDKTDYHFYESEAFDDTAMTGRGNLELFVKDDLNNDEMDIRIEKFNWNQVFYGPHDKKDLSDCDYLVKSKWYSLSQVKKLYPENADEITMAFSELADNAISNYGVQYSSYPYLRGDDGTAANINGYPLIDVERKAVRLTETWKKEYRSVKVLLLENGRTDYTFTQSENFPKEVFNRLSKLDGMDVKNTVTYDMKVITSVPGVILKKFLSPLRDFNMFPWYASKHQEFVQGLVEPIADSQREVNKQRSKMADLLNIQTGGTTFIDDDTFQDKREENEYISNSSTPGYVAKLRDVNRPPKKDETPRFPTELNNLMVIATNEMREISGITQELQGQQTNARSGVAIASRVKQSLITNEDIFDNLSLMKKRLGRLLIKVVQDVFTVDRIYKILMDSDTESPVTLTIDENGERVAKRVGEIPELVIKKFLENTDFTKYDVSITESTNTPTKNMERMQLFMEAMSTGSLNPVTIELFKDAGLISPLDAEKFTQMLLQQSQQQQLEEQRKSNTELAKSAGEGVATQMLQENLQQEQLT